MKRMINPLDLYTLGDYMTGDARVLNGKLFHISIDDHNQMTIIDHFSMEVLRLTSAIEDCDKNMYGWDITTKNGTKYKFYDIVCILPTNMSGFQRRDDSLNDYKYNDEENPFEELEETKNRVLSDIEKRHEEAFKEIDEISQHINNDLSSINNNSKLIDSMMKDLRKMDEKTLDDFPKVIKENKISKPIYPGDGYIGVEYTFEESISQKDFIEFCKLKGHNISKLTGYSWWEDHAVIENRDDPKFGGFHKTEGTHWTYKMIKPSTD